MRHLTGRTFAPMKETCTASAIHVVLAMAAALLLLPSCQKEDDDGPTSASIVFNSDSGFVYASETVGMEDTLNVGVIITSGDSKMQTVKVLASFDGAAVITVDSFPVDTEIFEFQKTIITRAVPGTEEWTFWMQQYNGDIYRRALTFTVE